MFIKKDLRKIPTILDEAVDCDEYDTDTISDDANNDHKQKRTKREEPLKALRLGRRKQEFMGRVNVLCQPSHAPKLRHLEVLNMYECNIDNLDGFGAMFEMAAPNLHTLNLGRNPLNDGIPDEFSRVRSLKHVWLDDCGLKGALPRALLHLPNIESLRLPNNNITHLPIGGIDTNRNGTTGGDGEEFEFDFESDAKLQKVIPLSKLKVLCLDRNQLGGGSGLDEERKKQQSNNGTTATETPKERSVANATNHEDRASATSGGRENKNKRNAATVMPSNLDEWAPNLEELFLRHNGFRKLGISKWPSTLKILHLSSNRLSNLDELMGSHGTNLGSSQLPSLTHLYANGNQLERVPEGILTHHLHLKRFVVSHNPPLKELPNEIWSKLGLLPPATENSRRNDASCKILWQPNRGLSAPTSSNKSENDENGDTRMQE